MTAFVRDLRKSINIKEFFDFLSNYLESKNEWYIRFAFVIMLNYYLESEFIDDVLARCDSVNSDKYYILMAQAWMLATAYAKQKEKNTYQTF